MPGWISALWSWAKYPTAASCPQMTFPPVKKWPVVAAGLAQFGFRNRRRIRQQRIQQRGLARAVAAHQRDLFAAHDAGGEAANHFGVAVRLAHAFEFQNVLARKAASART